VDARVVVPAHWLTCCVTPVVGADEVGRYGYQWFLMAIAFGTAGADLVGAGRGGQRLFIPALQLVVAISAGNYGGEDQGIPPTRVLREIVPGSVV